jgi:hypothetical protein
MAIAIVGMYRFGSVGVGLGLRVRLGVSHRSRAVHLACGTTGNKPPADLFGGTERLASAEKLYQYRAHGVAGRSPLRDAQGDTQLWETPLRRAAAHHLQEYAHG